MGQEGKSLAAWLERREPGLIDGHRVCLDSSGDVQTDHQQAMSVNPFRDHKPDYGGQAAVVMGGAHLSNYSEHYASAALRFEVKGFDERSLRRRHAMLELAQIAKNDHDAGAAMIRVHDTMITSITHNELYGHGGSNPVFLLVDVMEWATPLQAALEKLHWNGDRPMNAVKWVLPVLKAFDRLHTRHGVVHRDIDPGNLLVDQSGALKVTDWGIVTVLDENRHRITQLWGKQGSVWLAPEHRAKLNPNCGGDVLVHPGNDVWSLGCLLFLAVTGYEPIYRPDDAAFALPQPGLAQLPESLLPLLNRMLDTNHESRIKLINAIKSLENWLSERKSKPSARPKPKTPPDPRATPETKKLFDPVREPVRLQKMAARVIIGIIGIIGIAGVLLVVRTNLVPMSAPGPSSGPSLSVVVLPAGAVECERTGSGQFGAAARGNDVTSCPFVIAVRRDYLNSGIDGGNGTLRTWSPVMEQYYTMSCSGRQPAVCRGGNNAVVYIYGGQLRIG